MKDKKQVLVCDRCGAENEDLTYEDCLHDRPANPIKGLESCSGTWRLPNVSMDDRISEAIREMHYPKRKSSKKED